MTQRFCFVAPLVALLASGVACDKVKTCSTDMELCGGACAKLDTDPANCGACGHACGAGESCHGGACFCPFATPCGGACVDLESDPVHCGACDVACAGAEVCATPAGGATSCAASCATGQTSCGRACVSLQTHRQHCGACGRTCGSNERCADGRCVADLYLACFNTNEIREATGSLAAAGIPIPVAKGPTGLAWAGDRLGLVSGVSGGDETLTLLSFDPPGLRQARVWHSSVARANLGYVAEHDGLLYVSRSAVGTLLVVTPDGKAVDEVRLVPAGIPNPDPQAIAFDAAGRAYLALEEANELLVLDVSALPACAAGTRAPPCTTELARIDLSPLASPTAKAMPSRVLVEGGHAFVTLGNLDASWRAPAGSTGRLAAIRTDTLELDAAFAGSTHGLVDLGPDCLDAAGVAARAGKLYVTCGAWGPSGIVGSGIVAVDVSGAAAQVQQIRTGDADQAPGKLAFCGSTGYVGDRNSGRVWVFDPAAGSTTLGAGVELCPRAPNGYAYVADLACGR